MSERRAPIAGRYTREEVALAARNRGMPLEALRFDVTPAGLHYLLIHFDIASGDEALWRLEVGGQVREALSLGMAELKAMPAQTLRVTLECAGNGRGHVSPRYPSVPWLEEGVSTADWTGVPLSAILRHAGLAATAKEVVFHGADRGIDRGVEHDFARSLPADEARSDSVLLAYAMNGAPLPPQHGAPLRLVVPGWYGMASVKWLRRIEVLDRPFDGLQQAGSYHFKTSALDPGVPCRRIRVNSAVLPPGIPDFYTRQRVLDAGPVSVTGRAWSGEAPIRKVEFALDGRWREAQLLPLSGPHAWRGWSFHWQAERGEHELASRATDDLGNVQPLDPVWDLGGFGNNSVHRVTVTVR